MVYDPVQERMDELRELEPRTPAPDIDPWELLRELICRFDAYCKPPDGNNGLAWFHLCSGVKQVESELKRHDERKAR